MNRLFSIICTVRNRASHIRRSVESVLAQDDSNIEFVVQDGASTDGTLDILREYGDRISLVSEPDQGAGDGLFRAIRRARGELWGSCMSDEQLVPDAVSWARKTMATHTDLGAIYGYAEGVDRDGTLLSRQDAGEFSLEALLTYQQLPPFLATFFRMDAYRQLDLWNYTGAGEVDLWHRFAVRFKIQRFDKLVGYYGIDRGALSSQPEMFRSEQAGRLEALRRLFEDDPAGKTYQDLAPRAYAGYFLRYAGMFVRTGHWDLARESFRQAMTHLGSIEAIPQRAERKRVQWLQYSVEQPSNVWTALPERGIRRVAIFGGEGWGFGIYRQLSDAGVTCVAAIDNNASTREARMIPVPYYSQSEFLANGPAVDAVLSSLQGDHDRQILEPLQQALGAGVPVISWKSML